MSMPSDDPRPTIPLHRHDDDPADKVPPHNLDAERCVLGAILLDPEVLNDVASVLTPDDFFREAHQVVYRAMLAMRDAGVGIDAVTLADELEPRGRLERIGGDELLGQIANSVPHSLNAPRHAEIVRQKSISRQLIQSATETIRDGYSNLYTSAQLVERSARSIDRIAAEAAGGDGDAEEIADHPALPGEKAYHGPIGSMVKQILPTTEASPAAILLQMLAMFGSIVGRGPHWRHEATKHHLNLYCCVVGPTAVGRKGTSWDYVEDVAWSLDPTWSERVVSGITSGEKLVEMVADERRMPGGGVVPGVDDKRLMLLETEFARILAIFTRQGDSLSVYLRQFWERGNNGARSRGNDVTCTNAHVSLIAHVPPRELNTRLSLVDVANGLGNRFIWAWSIQSQELTSHVSFDWGNIRPMLADLKGAAQFARDDEHWADTPMYRNAQAEELWREASKALKQPRPGLLGDMLARARAQVMRMAAIYAVADRSRWIDVRHLEAALELWDYSVRSVDFIFGDRLADKDGEKLLAAIKAAGDAGLTQYDVRRRVFSGHIPGPKLLDLLTRLSQAGLIHKSVDATKGRTPVTTWQLGPATPPALSALAALAETPPPEDGPARPDERCKPPF